MQSGGNRCYRSLNPQLFFVCHATYKKIPPIEIKLHHEHFTDMHHHSPYGLTYLRQVKVVDLSFLFYFILYCCIESLV